MHAQLPDYDDFQGYDLVVGGILSQVSHKFTPIVTSHRVEL